MRELELAVDLPIEPGPGRAARAPSWLSRPAFVISLAVHVLAGYALTRQAWPGATVPPMPAADFFLFEMPAPRPRDGAPPDLVPEADPEIPPSPEPAPDDRAERAPEPAPPAQPAPERSVIVELPPAVEPTPTTEPATTPRAYIDFDEERRRAANQVIGSRSEESEYLTFSIDDVAPPRPEAEPERPPSIFEGTGGPRGPQVGQLGQARTKFGHRVSSLCNALTGGFSLMGFGSFCAGPPDGSPSGLLPEVRPAYLDLMPECVDTRDTAPALALEAPFSTVKCRLVKQEELPDEP